jgi:hypothetical protein
MAKLWVALLLGCGMNAGHARPNAEHAQPMEAPPPPIETPIAAPPEKKPPEAEKKPAPPSATCTLLTQEGPRGGRLEVEGQGFGKAPLVRIAGRVTRMIERTETRIAVQIPRDSDGGPVSVKVGELEVACGTLTIIGKNE